MVLFLIELVNRVMVMILLEMLQFLVLIIVHQFKLITVNIFFLALGKGPTDNINDSIVLAVEKFNIIFTKANIRFSSS